MEEGSKSWYVGNHIVCVNNGNSIESLKDRVEGVTISESVTVLDPEQQRAYLVLIHRINNHLFGDQKIRKVVKFSEEQHVPSKACCLALGTPAYYRSYEGDEKGVQDPMEGLLEIDTTPLMRERFSSELPTGVTNLEAKFTMKSSSEPWLYCTSICPDNRQGLRKLIQESSREAFTIIRDPDNFAIQLGVDFAINLDKSKDIELGMIWKLAYQNSSIETSLWEGSRPIDKIVHVYHGPVFYKDQLKVADALENFAKLGDWDRVCFTKQPSFLHEVEYRFALSALGRPKNERFFLKISDNLRNFAV